MKLKAMIVPTAFIVLVGAACAQSPPSSVREVTIAGCIPDCTVQLRGHDLRDLLRQVASNSGIRFVVDPRVNARFEFVGAPIAEITYPTLLGILRVHGFAAVDTGGEVSIIPDANVRAMNTRILQNNDPTVSDHEIVSRVISLSVDAEELVPILRPMVPQYGHLAAFGNSLLVVDRYDNVRRITQLAQSLSD